MNDIEWYRKKATERGMAMMGLEAELEAASETIQRQQQELSIAAEMLAHRDELLRVQGDTCERYKAALQEIKELDNEYQEPEHEIGGFQLLSVIITKKALSETPDESAIEKTSQEAASLKVFWTDDFKGHYPVGTAAVVVATSTEDAYTRLDTELSQHGLPQAGKGHYTLHEVDLTKGAAIVINNGDY